MRKRQYEYFILYTTYGILLGVQFKTICIGILIRQCIKSNQKDAISKT